MWFKINFSSDDEEDFGLAFILGVDSNFYCRLTDLLKLIYPSRNPYKLIKRFKTSKNARTIRAVIPPTVPVTYPYMKILSLEEAVNLANETPEGCRIADYLKDFFQTGHVEPIPMKTRFGSVYYCTNPLKSAVFRVAPRDGERSISVTELMQVARNKFSTFYDRLTPKSPRVSKRHAVNESASSTPCEGNLLVITDPEELKQHEWRLLCSTTLTENNNVVVEKQFEPKNSSESNNVIVEKEFEPKNSSESNNVIVEESKPKILSENNKMNMDIDEDTQSAETNTGDDNPFKVTFSHVPKEIEWFDGKNIYVFKRFGCTVLKIEDNDVVIKQEVMN
ncbi:hypothetical protein HNY73_011651 [Argiope bruennichi]|uniref:Uncharacterized protein n=1 Tax=Argiope bruennichi TaxID=94029 RepID=A0A8T0F0X3_ARGBR|nr:hypothetical protein HNY73_011651 [Argiope bruennichi]